MLLAAGRGERLKPLTDRLPKPLLPVGAKSLIEHNLERLKNAGIEEVVINVCYRARQIIETLGDGERFGLKITYSFEPDQPLGTGGGIQQALHILGDTPFILLSSDIWTDYPFEKLALSEGKLAHLVMVANPDFHPEGDYTLLSNGLLDQNPAPRLTYSNIAAIDPSLFAGHPAGAFPLAPLFVQAMTQQKISGELYEGAWFNVGTVEELVRLEESLS
ncbi:MAG: nucleotidyltransferase family protein [Coxiellaceae bacterium]|nr:nucleotidyltransferase family protein [Coxiellaceae bacterium]